MDRTERFYKIDQMLQGNRIASFARITEVSRGGSVPELAFENSSAEKILLVDGDELAGAKQNRIVNLGAYAGATVHSPDAARNALP